MPLVTPLSSRSWRRPQTTFVWGDGLIDQSLTTLWYPRTWRDVGEDELVLFIPSLGRRGASDEAGPALHIRRALTRRLKSAVRLLSTGNAWQTLERIVACRVISAWTPQKARAQARCDSHSDYRFTNYRFHPCSPAPRGEQPNDLVWVFELSVLACIDRMLLDALPTRSSSAECCIASADCTEVLVASIHTSLNGAYVYPQFAFAHELLGAAAWLGVLLRGRSAFMPVFVAQVLADYIGRGNVQDPIARLLDFHAELVGGSEGLLRRARKIISSGAPSIVTGGLRPTARASRPYVWNDRLSRRIAEQLTVSSLGAGHA